MRIPSLPLLLLGAVVLIVGCSKGGGVPARVSGKISYKGQPIKAGTMHFVTREGTSYTAQITNDGTYTATDLPEGEMIVTVETESVNPHAKGSTSKDADRRMKSMDAREPPAGAGGSPKSENAYIKIPDKFSKANTSPKSVTLTAGRQVVDIDLTD